MGGGERTDQVRVIRPQFVVQFGCVRFVDGIPEGHPASGNSLDVFRVGSPKGRSIPLPPRARLLLGASNAPP
jgi:hypothetical protein